MSNNEFLREYRKKLGLMQTEFAEKFNISVGTLRLWEQGRTKAPDYLILLLKEREELLNEIARLKNELTESKDTVYSMAKQSSARFDNNKEQAQYNYSPPGQLSLFDIIREMDEVRARQKVQESEDAKQ